MRRHPDVARRTQPGDVVALAAVQAELLAAAAAMVRPGGLVVYSACSLLPAEGPAPLAAALAGGAPLAPEPVVAGEIAGLAGLLAADGTLRTLPFHWGEAGGMDGFFAARLRRR